MPKPIADIRIEGIEKLQNKLGRLKAENIARHALKAGAEEIKDEAGRYPPEPTPRNPDYKYIRGLGTQYVPTGRVQKTSQNLKNRWSILAKRTKVVIMNVATYAQYVIGEFQTDLHKSTGWKQLNEVAKEHLPIVAEKLSKQVERILNE